MLVTVSLVTTVVLYFVTSWLWRRVKKGPRDPPVYPGDLPIIGHAHLFLGDTVHCWNMLNHISSHSLDNNGVSTVIIGNWIVYCLTDPEDCYQVGNACLDKDTIYDVAKPWVGDGLVTSSEKIWRRHRKLLNPAFSQHILDNYLTVFNAQSRKLIKNMDIEVGKGPFNHIGYLERSALETICLTAIGISEGDDALLKNFSYLDAFDDICHVFTERMQNAWMLSDFLYRFTKLKKKQDKVIKILHDMSNKVIQRRKAALLDPDFKKDSDNNSKKFKSFLSLLLETSMDGSLTDQEIREEVDTIIAAGFTSSSFLTFALVMIGSDKNVEEKIYEELQEVFLGSDRDVEKHDLPKLEYLEAVIKEVLRLYPVVPIIARPLHQDLPLKNYTLKAGKSVLINIHGMHRHKVWGSDRLEFRPERWLESGQVPNLPNAFAAFGVGRRNCIGQKFAYMSAKTTLCHLLRQYRIQADFTKMVLRIEVVIKAASGHNISIDKR